MFQDIFLLLKNVKIRIILLPIYIDVIFGNLIVLPTANAFQVQQLL